MSNLITPSPLLRTALRLDAAASGALGLLCAFGAGQLSGLLGLPQAFLMSIGLVCLAWAAVTAFMGTRQQVRPAFIWAIIALNGIWVIESAALLLMGWLQPTALGLGFVIAQALAVAAFTEMQFMGLRRSRRDDAVSA
jgi:CHASE2 domain-containing sensor protein